MENKKNKIIFVTSSTAGHTWPAVYLAKALQESQPNLESFFYISGSKIEQEILEKENLPYGKIYAGKWRRYFSILNFLDIFKTSFGFLQSLWFLGLNRPKLIFIKGGFTGIPIGFAAKILQIPVFLHESDVRLGLANQIMARFAQKLFVAFPKELYRQNPYFSKIESVGLPLKKEFYSFEKPKTQIQTLMFFGGSLGAKVINDTLEKILPDLLKDFQIIHICGAQHLEHFLRIKNSLAKDLVLKYQVFGFISQGLKDFFKQADLVISRAGATTIFELAAGAKPAILIPLSKKSSRGDQLDNVKFLIEKKACQVIYEEELSPEKLAKEIYQLKNNSQKIQNLSVNIHQLSSKDSITTIFIFLKAYL